jgi:hypothetical protein
MGVGKYSPNLPNRDKGHEFFKYNCLGNEPEEWNMDILESGLVKYNPKTMLIGYDDEGYDSYGYCAFNEWGEYQGHGQGIDRNGYTEDDYMTGEAEYDPSY